MVPLELPFQNFLDGSIRHTKIIPDRSCIEVGVENLDEQIVLNKQIYTKGVNPCLLI